MQVVFFVRRRLLIILFVVVLLFGLYSYSLSTSVRLVIKPTTSEKRVVTDFPNLSPNTTSSLRNLSPNTTSSLGNLSPNTTSSLGNLSPNTTSSLGNLSPNTTSYLGNLAKSDPNCTSAHLGNATVAVRLRSRHEKVTKVNNQWKSKSRPTVKDVWVPDHEWKGTSWKYNLDVEASRQNIFKTKIFDKKFLTIGISTVYRKEEYMKITLESLVNQTWTEERELVVIVIFLADRDTNQRNLQYKVIQDNFQLYLNSGFIQVIDAPSSIYPPFALDPRKPTHGDSEDRVIWRTKQVIDFAFLFTVVRLHDLSEYYLVAEDDILASNQYITAINDFVRLKEGDGSQWKALQFTYFVGITLLFNTRQLEELTQLFLDFYKQYPVDMIMRRFTDIVVNENKTLPGVINRIPSLFQHVGKFSTLPNKVQNLVDHSFGQGRRKFENHKNPPALRISTTLIVVDDFVPENAYSSAPGWFTGRSTYLQENYTFDILYEQPQKVQRIFVRSENSTVNEQLVNGTRNVKLKIGNRQGNLLIGSSLDGDPRSTTFCQNLNVVALLDDNGSVDITFNTSIPVQCVQLQFPLAQKSISIIEIKVF